MTPENKKKVIKITFATLLIGGVAAWLYYRSKEASATPDETLPSTPDLGGGSGETPKPDSSSTPIKVKTSDPIKVVSMNSMTSEQILSFQKFANQKGENLSLDGKWGPKTKSAWAKYGAEWQSIDPATGYQKDFVNAWTSAKKYKQPTFFFNGKTYSTATGRVYVPPVSGENALGKIAYPKGNFANVRSAPRAADGILDNTMLGRISSPKPIGKIKNLTIGADKFRWYEVDLISMLEGPLPYSKTGWVREDAIVIKNS